MNGWLSSVLVAIIAAVSLWVIVRVVRYKLLRSPVSALKPALNLLLRSGYHLSWITFTHERTGLFVQFRKYILDSNIVGIELGVPNTKKLEPFLGEIKAALTERRLKFRTVDGGSDYPEFFYADFGGDTKTAMEIGEHILLHIFKLPHNSRYFYYQEGIDVTGVEIINKTQQPKKWPEYTRH